MSYIVEIPWSFSIWCRRRCSRSFGLVMWKMKKFYMESMRNGATYIEYK